MSWETLTWRPADESSLVGAGALIDLLPLVRSALDESVAALIMGPASVTGLSTASTSGADLGNDFVAATSFALQGATRRTAWVALEPSAGLDLGGSPTTAPALAAALLDGLDGALAATVGEGLGLAAADVDRPAPDADLVLLRLAIRTADGTGVDLVCAVDAAVPAELATHVVTLRALAAGGTTDDAPAPAPTAGPALSTVPAGGVADHPAAVVRPLPLEELSHTAQAHSSQNIELLLGVNLQVTVEIGRTRLAIRDVLALTPGSIVELDKLAGEKVDVLVNGHPIASGEVVVVDDNFGVRITDVVSRQRRLMSADTAA